MKSTDRFIDSRPSLSIEEQVLVVNAGSSSLRVKLVPSGESVLIERIGGPTSAKATFTLLSSPRLNRHDDAFAFALSVFEAEFGPIAPLAVGHRVVHGGTRFGASTVIDDAVVLDIEALNELAPLHNPGNLAAISAARAALPDTINVAVFDTAFHATLPRRAFLYGLPLDYAERGIRRYGFHGTSHDYVTRRAGELIGVPREDLRIVSLHLGNGASATAVKFGRSIDTSMGFTPLEGLLMGTRSGDIDPGVLFYLQRHGASAAELDELLNRGSGLRGMSGVSNDMRDVRAAAEVGSEAAQAALELFSYRISKVIGAYAAAMGGLDLILFTGGIGENDAKTRAESVRDLGFLGVLLDDELNEQNAVTISRADSAVRVMVVATDEEGLIATEARRVATAIATQSAAGAGEGG